MKKRIAMILSLCVLVLGGCRYHFNVSSGLSSFIYEDSDRYTMGGASLHDTIENIEIEWLSGKVQVAEHDKNTIEFTEESNKKLDKDTTLYYWLNGKTLYIQFCRSGKWNFDGLEKDLILWLPKDIHLNELKIDSVSAVINAGNVKAAKVELNSVSGETSLIGGEIKEIKGDFVSGDVFVACRTAPEKMEIDTVSGAVALFLAETADFTLDYETVSGDLSSDISFKKSGDDYICGDGTYQYEIDTVSGDVSIKIQD